MIISESYLPFGLLHWLMLVRDGLLGLRWLGVHVRCCAPISLEHNVVVILRDIVLQSIMLAQESNELL